MSSCHSTCNRLIPGMQAPAKAEDAFAKALPSSSAPNCWEEGSLHLPVGKAIGSPAGESRERRGKVAPSCKGKDDRCSEEASLLRILAVCLSAEPLRPPGAWQPPPPGPLSLGAAPPFYGRGAPREAEMDPHTATVFRELGMHFRPRKMIFEMLAPFANLALGIDLPANSKLPFLLAFARCGLFCVLSATSASSWALWEGICNATVQSRKGKWKDN